MRNKFFALFLLSVFLLSCDRYKQSSVSSDYVSSLNFELANGHKNEATWANSPEGIARHFFPPVSHYSGLKRYEVSKKVESINDCIVTVVEEGAIDDEVLGERHTLHFHGNEKHLTIADVKLEIKQRQ